MSIPPPITSKDEGGFTWYTWPSGGLRFRSGGGGGGGGGALLKSPLVDCVPIGHLSTQFCTLAPLIPQLLHLGVQ